MYQALCLALHCLCDRECVTFSDNLHSFPVTQTGCHMSWPGSNDPGGPRKIQLATAQ